ncbi:MAG: branched-chain amino acid transport system / permease component family protein [Conexibacter sp.]|nr:branched-chain amino acid transport system / permease component family protein [Conexibacter sp.]
MPTLLAAIDYKPFVVSGLALGGVYALSGVGIVAVFRATGVLNFAYGATGAFGAMVAWQLTDTGTPQAVAYLACLAVAIALSVAYGLLLAPRLSARDPEVRATATLGYALVLLGVMLLIWADDTRTTSLPTDDSGFGLAGVRVTTTQVVALAIALVTTIMVSVVLGRFRLGTAMRALASDRELSALLGIGVRRAELAAWALGGLLAGLSGLLLANLVATEPTTLTFLVVASLSAAVIGRLRSLWMTVAGGLVVGVLQAMAIPHESIVQYRDATPFVVAAAVLLLLQLPRGAAGVRAR